MIRLIEPYYLIRRPQLFRVIPSFWLWSSSHGFGYFQPLNGRRRPANIANCNIREYITYRYLTGKYRSYIKRESQRAQIAARIANMTVGGKEANSANLQNCTPVSQTQAAEMLNVSPRLVASAKKVEEKGIPELSTAVRLAISLKPYYEEKAKERQGMRTDIVDKCPQCSGEQGKARDHAAKLVGIGEHTIQDAKPSWCIAFPEIGNFRIIEAPEIFQKFSTPKL
jgi:hypothetical protein